MPPTNPAELREKIARVIAPVSWGSWDAVAGTVAIEWRASIVANSLAKADAILSLLEREPVPEVGAGWVLVPRQSTLAMEKAGGDADVIDGKTARDRNVAVGLIWRAMLAASPPPPPVTVGEEYDRLHDHVGGGIVFPSVDRERVEKLAAGFERDAVNWRGPQATAGGRFSVTEAERNATEALANAAALRNLLAQHVPTGGAGWTPRAAVSWMAGADGPYTLRLKFDAWDDLNSLVATLAEAARARSPQPPQENPA